jgi:membrane protease YdiL (CAAX protease family)
MKLFQDIRRHPVISLFVAAVGGAVLACGVSEGKVLQTSGYLAALLLSVVVIDLLAAAFESDPAEVPVRSPRKELSLILSTQAVVIIFAVVRFQFFADWQAAPFLSKLPFYLVNGLLVFPIVLVAAFLKWGYSFRDIGFRLRHFWFGLPVIAIFGLVTYLVIPERNNFAVNYRELGLVQMFFVSFTIAAMPEEFVRYLTQTRLGKVLANNAAGWLIASVIWALLHLPSFYANNTRGFAFALLGVVNILPLGLLWSFINHRTRSIIPAVLVHGTNLWALQDL